jgi:protein-disulfide isomerase
MNRNDSTDDEAILEGLRRHMAGVEGLIPEAPVLDASFAAATPIRSGVVVRSRVGWTGFASLALVAAIVVVAVGAGLAGRASGGPGAAPSSGTGSVAITYSLVLPSGAQVTKADLDATKAVLESRLASVGISSAQVKLTTDGQSWLNSVWVYAEGLADPAPIRRLAQTGRVEFVLLPPETYGTSTAPGTKPVPNVGDAIDPTLPAQFTSADIDPSQAAAELDSGTGMWAVAFGFNDASIASFAAWSGQHVGDYFALVLDGKAVTVPFFVAPITDGKGKISGFPSADSAKELAAIIRSGPLPYPLAEQSSQENPTTIVGPDAALPAGIVTSGRTVGNASAPVTIDVYVDYQCAACSVLYRSVLPQVIETYVMPGEARIVFHDFIVIDSATGGQESLDAANAARCAADQGQFDTYQAWLFANQGTEGGGAFSKARLVAIAEQAGLDGATFQTCVDNGSHNAEVRAESDAAATTLLGVPSILVNGKPLSSVTYDDIKAAVDAALLSVASPSTSTSPSAGSPATSSAASSSVPTQMPTAVPSTAAAATP